VYVCTWQRLAADFTLFAVCQGEGVLGISLAGRPAGGGVAGLALAVPKNSFMEWPVLGGPGRALRGAGALEFLINVAGGARYAGMLALQGEDLAMIEILHVAGAIVAANTIGAVLLHMLLHKRGVMVGVAVDAPLRVDAKVARRLAWGVTGQTGDRLAVIAPRVIDQLECGVGMLEERLAGQVRGAPGRCRVAAGAILVVKGPGVAGRRRVTAGAVGRRVPGCRAGL